QAEQIARLRVVIVVHAVIPVVGGLAVQRQRRFRARGLLPLALAVGFVVDGAALVVAHAHRAVAMVAVMEGTARRIDRQQAVVHAQAVALGVAVGEDAALQPAVGRMAYAGHEVGRREGGLLHLRE